ncbi:LamG-like jellyroll fold domain-containing protein [Paenibacillus andongensis]|uniref:LamG-like jellyroll fold domain-containing protein n=1 Tax=Paenibacillus andongensis TaxID=2975482 RepID=UPI0021BA7A21|nr:LamG-like jellyroll fold domain-containing protein [Paenibacillus andongensis]
MNLNKRKKRFQRIALSILCFMLAMTGFLSIGSQTAKAAISPLITSYKPQVVNTDTNVSYTDGNGNTISGVLHHPGIAMRQSDLDNMRDHVRAGDEPWNTAFNKFASDGRSSKTPRILYEGNYIFIHVQGPWGFTDPNTGVFYSNPSDYVGTRANTDSEVAFMQAIMWYITGDETYRSNAMTIIRDYAAIQDCVTHYSFRFATATYLLGAAAEILRYSDTPTQSLKWAGTDTTNLTHMMDVLSVTYNAHSFFMNQHQFTVMGTIGRAIFKNDYALYAEAVEASTVNSAGDVGGRNGSIKYQMRWMTQNEVTGAALDPADYHVQEIEMGRDAGHSYDDIAGLSTLAQTIYAQGTKVDPTTGAMSTAANAVNVFNFLDDRLLAGTNYVIKYHLGYDELWTPAWANQASDIQYYETINSGGRGRIDAFYSVLYDYYKYIQHVDMTQEKYKYLAYVYETRMPEVAGKDYPLAMLLYTPDAAKSVGLSNQITLGAITGLTATAAGANTISLSWNAVSGSLGYNIYRSTRFDGTYAKINSAPVSGTSYSSTGLDPDTIYYYKVGAAGGSASNAVSAQTGGTSVIDAGMMNWYKFDESSGTTTFDASGSGGSGAVNGGASWVNGYSGNAVDLDGTDDYVSLPSGVVSGDDAITIAAWVNLDSASNWSRIFDFGSGANTYMFLTPKNGANGNIRFAIKNNGSSEQIIDGTSALATGGWHHVAVTLNGSTGILYVDGVQAGSNTAMTIRPSAMGATTRNWIGRSQYSGDPYLDGRVDDFRIYNRALPPALVADVMNGESVLPTAQLAFDETSGTSASDGTGDGWNGMLVNSPSWVSGYSGNAVDLNGSNQYVSLPNSVVSSDSTVTIACRVNLDAVSNWSRIFDFGTGTNTYMFLTPKNGSNGKIRFAIKNNGSSEQIIEGTSSLATGGWHHVAVTLNGSTGTLYVDGVRVGSNTSMTIKPSDMGSTTQNWIGHSQYTTDPYLNGRVDDFRIYSQALSAADIAALAALAARSS